MLVQGAGGGVATAAVVLAARRWASGSTRPAATPRKRERIAALGATALEPGARLPERVDVVIETVGAATFDHSLKCAAPGARIVVSGSTAGHLATVDLRRVFALQLEILGSSMGTRDELAALLDLVASGVKPVVDSALRLLRGPGRLRTPRVRQRLREDRHYQPVSPAYVSCLVRGAPSRFVPASPIIRMRRASVRRGGMRSGRGTEWRSPALRSSESRRSKPRTGRAR